MSLNKESDESLMLRIGQEDRAAYAVLVERHLAKNLGFATKFLGDAAMAHDIMQEAYLRVWRYAARWDPAKNTKFTTWFYRVVTNLCLDAKRKEKKTETIEHAKEVASKEVAADVIIEDLERSKALSSALDQLPERQKTAVVLCYMQELSNKEAAEIMDISLSAIEALLVRARRSLSEILKPEKEELLKEIRS